MCGNPFFLGLIFNLLFIFPTMIAVGFFLCKLVFNRFCPLMAGDKLGGSSFLLSLFLSSVLFYQFEVFLWKDDETKYKKHQAEMENKCRVRAQTEWDKFLSVEKELYKAKDDRDPSVQKLRQLWDRHLKIGPYHSDGKRELALDGSDMFRWCPQTLQSRWFIGQGFPLKESTLTDFYIFDGSETRSAEDNEFCVSANRNGDGVDIEFYTDFQPVSRESYYTPERTVWHCVGAEGFDRFVRKVSVHKRSDAPKDQKLDQSVYVAFLSKLTPDERAGLNAIVTSKPCVVQTYSEPRGADLGKYQLSPFITLKRADTKSHLY